MVLDPIPQPLPVHFFGSRPQPPTSRHSKRMNTLYHTRIRTIFWLWAVGMKTSQHVQSPILFLNIWIFFWCVVECFQITKKIPEVPPRSFAMSEAPFMIVTSIMRAYSNRLHQIQKWQTSDDEEKYTQHALFAIVTFGYIYKYICVWLYTYVYTYTM